MASRKSILIVDDMPSNIQLVASELKNDGYAIAVAKNGLDALEQASHKHFDLVLLDIMMPQMDGIEVCRRLKGQPEYKDTPVIFLTAKDEKETLLRGFEVGGVDYVTKPFYGPEVRSRVKAQLRAQEANEILEQAVDDLNRQLLASVQHESQLKREQNEMARFNRSLLERANTDPLTGLANRYHLTSIAQYEQERSARAETTFSVILADIDHFKEVNDHYGHDCGDKILKGVAQRMQAVVRAQDRIARWGGEEFLVFLPDTVCDGASMLAERLRGAVADTPFSCDGIETPITISLGVNACSTNANLDRCIEQADVALYAAKDQGRNRCVAFEDTREA
ncbi:MAG: diguanylate cyclase [Spirochaetota bacterium]